MSNLKVCLYPQTLVWKNKEANMRQLETSMPLIHPETDLLILPETFSTGCPYGDKEEVRPLAERNSGETVDRLKALAHKYNIAIAGSFIADTGGLLANRAFFIEPSGDEYFADKRHLFSMAGENRILSPRRQAPHGEIQGLEHRHGGLLRYPLSSVVPQCRQ